MNVDDGRDMARPWVLMRQARIEPVIAYRGVPGGLPGPTQTLRVLQQHHVWWWIRTGAAFVRLAERRLRFDEGCWVLLPSGVPREQRFSADARIVSLNFTAVWGNNRPMLTGRSPITRPALAGNGLCRAAAEVARAFESGGGPGHRSLAERRLGFGDWTRMQSALHRFAGLLAPLAVAGGWELGEPGTGDARMDQILDTISARQRAGPLPYAGWRETPGIGRAQVDRLALRHLGMTLRAHRDNLLVSEIRRRLLWEGTSMKELAADLGFVDAAHFSHWVTRHTGAPPAAMLRGLA